MTVHDLQKLHAIYLPNIQEGFNKYTAQTLQMNAADSYVFFQKICKNYNYEHSYVDFYYYTFNHDVRDKINALLTEDEIYYLTKNSPEQFLDSDESISDHIIFPITDTLLEIVCKLNATATLFSTLYFTGDAPCTFWGNYNEEYIQFS